MAKEAPICLGGNRRFTIALCAAVARRHRAVALDHLAAKLMERSHALLSKLVNARVPIYGVNTQFGGQVAMLEENLTNHDVLRYLEALKERQRNLVVSHNCGLGEEVAEEIVRAAMALRAHCLGLGYSGVRPVAAEALVNFLNKGIHPIIHTYGSIGASGDLIPLSAIAAALVGEKTEVIFAGERMDASKALKEARLEKLTLELREGLALINGTSFMAAAAGLALFDLQRLFGQMLSAVAMALEALAVIESSYAPKVHELKGQAGEIWVNDFLLRFWKGSRLIRTLSDVQEENLAYARQKRQKATLGQSASIRFMALVAEEARSITAEEAKALQDFYSLRAVAQGFGPFHENLMRALTWVENEMNSVNDNPILDAAAKNVYHAANFMGYYVTEACDMLKMDIAQASTWLHAILANLVHPRKNYGLPANLVREPEVYNGFRPLQILAASLAVENRKLAQAHQAYMLPTEGDNQDVNSLGTHAAIDLRAATENLERLTAILLLAAAQALELRGVNNASPRAGALHKAIRKASPRIDADRPFREDIERVIALLRAMPSIDIASQKLTLRGEKI